MFINGQALNSSFGVWWQDSATAAPRLLPYTRTSINVSSSGDNIVVTPSVATVTIGICGLFLWATGAVTVNVKAGAGGSNFIGPIPFTAAAQAFIMQPVPGMVLSVGSAVNLGLNINLGAAVQVTGWALTVEI